MGAAPFVAVAGVPVLYRVASGWQPQAAGAG